MLKLGWLVYGVVLMLEAGAAQSSVYGKKVVTEKLSQSMRMGSVKELVGYFNEVVEIEIDHRSNKFSCKQTVMIVQDFLKEEQVIKYEVKHTGESQDGTLFFIIGELTTKDKEKRNVYFLMKQQKSKQYKIQSIRIG